MKLVTAIKPQVKRQDRFSIYLDGKYGFSLSKDQLKESGLLIGDQLTDEDIEKYSENSKTGKLYEKTVRWISLRPRSRWEINEYLRKQTDNENVQQIIYAKLDDLGQINDKAFAESWLNSRRSLRKTSRRRIKQELQQKRVPKDIIESVLIEDGTDEIGLLVELVEKKRRIKRYQDDEKLLAYLSRQGFNYEDIKNALNKVGND